jgi:preprotein translocase subunit SecA
VFAACGRGSDPVELAVESLIDRQRAAVYGFRAAVRGEPDPFVPVRPLVAAAVQTWLAGGAPALHSGLRDVLAGRPASAGIDAVLAGGGSPDELAQRAYDLVASALDQRADELGPPVMAALLRRVLLTVVDLQWPEHLRRLRFLRRQAAVLYGADAGRRESDTWHLFAACEQAIRVEALKYALNARP